MLLFDTNDTFIAHTVRRYCPGAYSAHVANPYLVMEFGQIVKRSVEKEGLLGWQFNTIGVSDAITMGGDGRMLRHCLCPRHC